MHYALEPAKKLHQSEVQKIREHEKNRLLRAPEKGVVYPDPRP